MTLITLDELKTYVGATTNNDDLRLASAASNASIMAERDTGRRFAVASNVTHTYSTDGSASINIHDRPRNDSSRTVRLGGVDLTENTLYWLLPDRRNEDVSVTIQLAYYGNRPDWFKADPNWWDRNLDTFYGRGGQPNDLVITGVEGHPTLPADVRQGVLELAAFLYWNEKSGASGFVQTPQGDQVELGDYPQSYKDLVRNWKIHTAVAGI